MSKPTFRDKSGFNWQLSDHFFIVRSDTCRMTTHRLGLLKHELIKTVLGRMAESNEEVELRCLYFLDDKSNTDLQIKSNLGDHDKVQKLSELKTRIPLRQINSSKKHNKQSRYSENSKATKKPSPKKLNVENNVLKQKSSLHKCESKSKNIFGKRSQIIVTASIPFKSNDFKSEFSPSRERNSNQVTTIYKAKPKRNVSDTSSPNSIELDGTFKVLEPKSFAELETEITNKNFLSTDAIYQQEQTQVMPNKLRKSKNQLLSSGDSCQVFVLEDTKKFNNLSRPNNFNNRDHFKTLNNQFAFSSIIDDLAKYLNGATDSSTTNRQLPQDMTDKILDKLREIRINQAESLNGDPFYEKINKLLNTLSEQCRNQEKLSVDILNIFLDIN